jgi:hypothetical protein
VEIKFTLKESKHLQNVPSHLFTESSLRSTKLLFPTFPDNLFGAQDTYMVVAAPRRLHYYDQRLDSWAPIPQHIHSMVVFPKLQQRREGGSA